MASIVRTAAAFLFAALVAAPALKANELPSEESVRAPVEAAAENASSADPKPQGNEVEAALATETAPVSEPFAKALETALSPSAPDDAPPEIKREETALADFYRDRGFSPLWIEEKGYAPAALTVIEEIGKAADYGLDPAALNSPSLAHGQQAYSPAERAEAEIALARAILTYARHARGGRIRAPADLLNTNLDRKPQLLDPRAVLEGIAAATDKASFLAATNPDHVQFQRLREKLLALRAEPKSSGFKAQERRLLANMEMWRWMWPSLGELYIMANVPEYMIRLVKNGETIHTERIVVGELDKQTSIFSRPLKSISFRPLWRVPESIKVRELWPSLLKGGGLMRQYGLELHTKDGRPLDWRTMDWTTADIREYDVVQPPGRKSVLGHVKFNFPSQHTIFMHDTPDKWMFNSRQRTLSHGCLRLRDPLRMAELVMAEDKGWDRAKIDELVARGPLNNEVMIEKKLPMHIVYFTASVDDDGKLSTWPDIYGHERRVALALEGRWNEINKGKDHLAPVELSSAPVKPTASRKQKPETSANSDFMSAFFGAF